MPQKVFNPEDRYKIWKQDWALSQQNIQVSKSTISPWVGFCGQLETPSESRPRGDRWGAPTAVAGSFCLPRAVLSVSISQAPNCPQVSGSEIVGSLAINRRAFPHRSHWSHFVPLCFPLLPLMWDKNAAKTERFKEFCIFIYVYIYDSGKALTLKKLFPLTGCTCAWHI